MLVYRKSIEALDTAVRIAEEIPRGHRQFADQLKRASSSVCLNTAEGVGEYKSAEKARFYRMALRSVSESVSIVQILHKLKILDSSTYSVAYVQFTETAKMLTKLIGSMDRRR
ncbi:MAG: four helix bundle protein [Desulfobulbaceae bacterium]|nr:four helix bundle protein [Desulfobulbaceae bacterium]